MLDETGKVFELKVFCNNNQLKEKLESKFKSVSFKDFQEFTYYTLKYLSIMCKSQYPVCFK